LPSDFDLGRLDVVINNAGVGITEGPLEEIPMHEIKGKF
jgi:NAD(P)-dependent dehydrogenase (short-subunit alcohol dehydrogenase family)